jgi:hypothetical protein
VERLYLDGAYARLDRELTPVLEPVLPFLDLPNDLTRYVSLWLRCRYRMGDAERTLRTCDAVMARAAEGPLHDEARLYKALALWDAGDLPQVRVQMEKLEAPDGSSPIAPPFWYLRTRLHMVEEAWDEARAVAARMVAFSGKDFHWLPAGLTLSLRLYLREEKVEVARGIWEELQAAYPASPWVAEAAVLAEGLPPPRAPDAPHPADAPPEPEPPRVLEIHAVSFARRVDGSGPDGDGHFGWRIAGDTNTADAVYQGATAPDARYMVVRPVEGLSASPSRALLGPSMARVEYDLQLPRAGVHALEIRAAGRHDASDALSVEVPGALPLDEVVWASTSAGVSARRLEIGTSGAFAWYPAGQWNLSKGTATVRIIMNKPDVAVDAVRLTHVSGSTSPLPAAGAEEEDRE